MASITLKSVSLEDYRFSERVQNLKDIYFRALPEICTERSVLITRYHVENGLLNKERISILDKAKAYKYVLENRAPIVSNTKAYEKGMKPFPIVENSLFAGSTTSKFKGVPLYPEYLALAIWPELWTISKRERNPYHISDSEVRELNLSVFPHWIENNITELTRKRCYEENYKKYGRENYAPGMKLLERLVFFIASKPNCISHTIPDFSRVINEGLHGIIADAMERRLLSENEQKKEFYTAVIEVLEGIIAYSNNLAAKAREEAGNEANPARKQELLDIADIYDRIPEQPSRTFREGLTAVWICWIALHLENANVGLSLGRLDQLLYDLYRNDIDSKNLTVDEAIELLCCLWLKIGDHVPTVPEAGEQLFGGTGSNQAITIGGVDKEGKDAVNDLTYIMLRAIELMRLRDPNLNARYFIGVNSRDYLKRLCEVNVNTGATPALHNDRAVIDALVRKGETLEHARDYGVIGCVEPGSSGRSYAHSGALLLNLTSVLELTLFNGRHRHTGMDVLISKETGDPTKFKSFEDFRNAFREQAHWIIRQSTQLNNTLGRIHQDFYPTPIISALFEGPMEKGRDVIEGGAVYNSSGAAIIGLADVADSLSAIEHTVYERKDISVADLIGALNENYEGNEALRKRLANPDKTPKFGNEDSMAERNIMWIVKMLDEAFGSTENYRGGRYRVGYWTMTNHAGFGRLMQATPNGRKARENFSSGITPVSGETPFLTKTLNSVADISSEYLSNGVALNIKYTPETGDMEKMIEEFVQSVEGYFSQAVDNGNGGMEIQFNVMTREKFIDAVKHPENYPELLVRVSGYTAYFKDLNPQMKKEIIDRTEYKLSTGKAEIFGPFSLKFTEE